MTVIGLRVPRDAWAQGRSTPFVAAVGAHGVGDGVGDGVGLAVGVGAAAGVATVVGPGVSAAAGAQAPSSETAAAPARSNDSILGREWRPNAAEGTWVEVTIKVKAIPEARLFRRPSWPR
jgi:hypothetical protein